MPKEINRIVTDAICDYFFTTSKDASENLIKEGKPESNIFLVGNLMIDTLFFQLEKLEKVQGSRFRVQPVESAIGITTSGRIQQGKGSEGNEPYALVTLHRPSNVDDSEVLLIIMETLQSVAEKLTVVFPVHPRTRQHLQDLQFSSLNSLPISA